MSSVFSLFNLFALFYVFRSVQLSFKIWREWSEIKSEPLTAYKKSLANQASFFIAVPISVLIHELAHALAVIIAGGEVAEFQYRVFWGYVVPRGTFTETQLWWIAIAGTLGSILFGLGQWLLLRKSQSSSVRYFGLRALRYQIYFSLIYYPLFTLLGFDGDWKIIYDFAATPLLSGATALFHAAILYAFWRFDRQGWFEVPAFADAESQQQYVQMSAAAAANPQDIALQLQVIDTLRRGGAAHMAKFQLEHLIQQNPNSALANLEKSALQSEGKSTVPPESAVYAEKALELGLSMPGQRVFAYDLLGRYQLEHGQLDQAAVSTSEALTICEQSGNKSAMIDLLILRSQVYRRRKNYTLAYQDLQQALTAAQQIGDESAVGRVNGEIEILAKHAGQPFLLAPLDPYE